MQGTICVAAQSEAKGFSCGAGNGIRFGMVAATNWESAVYGCDGTQPRMTTFSFTSDRFPTLNLRLLVVAQNSLVAQGHHGSVRRLDTNKATMVPGILAAR
jgi:hypothetical protein